MLHLHNAKALSARVLASPVGITQN